MTVTVESTRALPRCPRCDHEHRPGSPSCPQSRVGMTLGHRYRLGRLIGAGGMGAVYEAENLELGRRVAIKCLHPGLAAREDAVVRFRREARSVAMLRHPGFAQVFALETDCDEIFIEMELLDGTALDRLLDRGPLPIERMIAILESTLEALAVAHAANLVHRDLKPENLFLCKDGVVKILDFGLARVQDGASITTSGEFMGTVLYASPEQLRDAASADARSDVYSLGATAFELVTGTRRCEGTIAEVMSKVLLGRVERRARVRRPDVPAWLDELLARALDPDPARRFADAREMLACLRAARPTALVPVRPPANRSLLRIAFGCVAFLAVFGKAVVAYLEPHPYEEPRRFVLDAPGMIAPAIAPLGRESCDEVTCTLEGNVRACCARFRPSIETPGSNLRR